MKYWKNFSQFLLIFTGVISLIGMFMTCSVIFKVNKYNKSNQINDQKMNNIYQLILEKITK